MKSILINPESRTVKYVDINVVEDLSLPEIICRELECDSISITTVLKNGDILVSDSNSITNKIFQIKDKTGVIQGKSLLIQLEYSIEKEQQTFIDVATLIEDLQDEILFSEINTGDFNKLEKTIIN